MFTMFMELWASFSAVVHRSLLHGQFSIRQPLAAAGSGTSALWHPGVRTGRDKVSTIGIMLSGSATTTPPPSPCFFGFALLTSPMKWDKKK